MKKSALLIVILSLFVASPVMAEEQIELATTSYLYSTCLDVVYKDETLATSAYCKAFIQGAVNAHTHLTSYHKFPRQYCLPSAISEKEIIRIFMKLVEENPNVIEKPAISTLYSGLNEAFPCAESPPSK